jgi:hypothetical protein
VEAGESYLGCHIHVDTLVSRTSQPEARELQRVYRNGCRCNERLNTETGGSKTPRTHWGCAGKHIVSLVLR